MYSSDEPIFVCTSWDHRSLIHLQFCLEQRACSVPCRARPCFWDVRIRLAMLWYPPQWFARQECCLPNVQRSVRTSWVRCSQGFGPRAGDVRPSSVREVYVPTGTAEGPCWGASRTRVAHSPPIQDAEIPVDCTCT